MGDAGGHQGAGEGAEGLPVDGNAVLLVQAHQPVHVHPVGHGALQGDALGVGDIVGDAAALIAGKAAGQGDLCQQAGVGGAVAHLHRHLGGLGHLAAAGDAVVDPGEAVEHGLAQPGALPDAQLRFLVAVEAGIGVDGGGQQVGLALVLQVVEQLDVLLDQRHAGPGLDQGIPVFLGQAQLAGKALGFRYGLLVGKGLVQVHSLARGPLAQDHLAQLHEIIHGDLAVANLRHAENSFIIRSLASASWFWLSRPMALRI